MKYPQYAIDGTTRRRGTHKPAVPLWRRLVLRGNLGTSSDPPTIAPQYRVSRLVQRPQTRNDGERRRVGRGILTPGPERCRYAPPCRLSVVRPVLRTGGAIHLLHARRAGDEAAESARRNAAANARPPSVERRVLAAGIHARSATVPPSPRTLARSMPQLRRSRRVQSLPQGK